jgi:hypothetical protein
MLKTAEDFGGIAQRWRDKKVFVRMLIPWKSCHVTVARANEAAECAVVATGTRVAND